jgi:uracil-DNA glycosylase
LGQDPYHGPKQAHGLCFSVQKNIPSPPSLVNIFQEIERDLGIPKPNHGCLSHWASQGVFLLNTILTVREAEPLSHSNQGWEIFTDKVIEILNTQYEHLIFVFWGKPAQKKAKMIDHNKHRVLTSAHPSPLSAYRGFKGCGHFSSINQQLLDWKKNTIDWSLP